MPDPSQKKEKILIIEGNISVGEHFADALRAEGYTVFLVRDGAEGFKNIMDILPHLIIIGLVLTGGDAYDILQKKQAEAMLAKIPVFLLSTQGAPINMRRVPPGSVAEFIVTLEPDPAVIVRLADRQFNHAANGSKAADTAPVGEAPSSAPKKTILWVEDDKLIGSIMGKRLDSSEFDLIHVKDGNEAFSRLKTVIPDIIVLDLLLPGMDGFEILQKIKMDERLKKVPVMILSNLSKSSDLEKAKLLGATKFIVKAASSLDNIIAEVRAIAG